MESQMIRIKSFKDHEGQMIFVGSIYKTMSEYMAGQDMKIHIESDLSLKEISESLRGIAEIISAAEPMIEEEDIDPADEWKSN